MFTIGKQLKIIRKCVSFEGCVLAFIEIYKKHNEEMFLYPMHGDNAKKIKYFTDEELNNLIPYYISITPSTDAHKNELEILIFVINDVLNKRKIKKILKLKDRIYEKIQL